METAQEEVSGIVKLDRNKASYPRLRVFEKYLTFILAICTQFYVIIYNIIEAKREFAIATQAWNDASQITAPP